MNSFIMCNECLMYVSVAEHKTGPVNRAIFICPRCFLENHYQQNNEEKEVKQA